MPPRKRSGKKRGKTSSKRANEVDSTEHKNVASEDPVTSTLRSRHAKSPINVAPSPKPSTTLTPSHTHPSTLSTTHPHPPPPITTPVHPSHFPSPTFTPVSQLDLTVTYDYGGGFPESGAVSPRKTIEEVSNLFNFNESNPRVSHHVNLWRDLSPSSHTPPPPKRHKPHPPHTLTTHAAMKDYHKITLLASQLQDRLAQHSKHKSQFPDCKTKLSLEEDNNDDSNEDHKHEGITKVEGDTEVTPHRKPDSSLISFGEEDEGFWATAADNIDTPSNKPMAGSTPCHSHEPLARAKLFSASEVGTLPPVNSQHNPGNAGPVNRKISAPSSHSSSLYKALNFDEAFENESDDFVDKLLLDGFDSALEEVNGSSLQSKPISYSKGAQKDQRVTVPHNSRHTNIQENPIATPQQQYAGRSVSTSNQTCSTVIHPIKELGARRHQAHHTAKRPADTLLHQASQSTQRVQCSQSEIEVKKERARLKLLARRNQLLSRH